MKKGTRDETGLTVGVASAAAFEAFENDPDFEKASALRDTGAKLVTVTAHSGLPPARE